MSVHKTNADGSVPVASVAIAAMTVDGLLLKVLILWRTIAAQQDVDASGMIAPIP